MECRNSGWTLGRELNDFQRNHRYGDSLKSEVQCITRGAEARPRTILLFLGVVSVPHITVFTLLTVFTSGTEFEKHNNSDKVP